MDQYKNRRRLDLRLALRGEDGQEVEVAPTWSSGDTPMPHTLGPEILAKDLLTFADGVRKAAETSTMLGPDLISRAQAIHGALFREGAALPEGEPILVRVFTEDAALRGVPWEALCIPHSERRFLGSSPDRFIARGVYAPPTRPGSKSADETWREREVRGPITVLAIAPLGRDSLAGLEAALADHVSNGEVALEIIAGKQAESRYLLDRLQSARAPNVIHFVGHGGKLGGSPALELGGEEPLVRVERLAEALESQFGGALRLIVLEACRGGEPGALGAAADMLACRGADAVVAHLWTVSSDLARDVSRTLYRRLVDPTNTHGDVAVALNAARLQMLIDYKESAEVFSTALYLRSPDSVIFDFTRRNITAPAPPAPPPPEGTSAPPQSLATLLASPFSLLLGDSTRDDLPRNDGLRKTLLARLKSRPNPPNEGLPLSAIAQRFMLEFTESKLHEAFDESLETALESTTESSLLRALAQRLECGVHITLQRLPLLEEAIAKARPSHRVYVILPQPDRDTNVVLRCMPNQDEWETLDDVTADEPLDPATSIVILRLYRGQLPRSADAEHAAPLITEDDYLFGMRDLESLLGSPTDGDTSFDWPGLGNKILRDLSRKPMLLIGLSALAWHHRMLLSHLLGGHPLPLDSVAVIERGDVTEQSLWKRGSFLPGTQDRQTKKAAKVAVVDASAEELTAWLEASNRSGRTT